MDSWAHMTPGASYKRNPLPPPIGHHPPPSSKYIKKKLRAPQIFIGIAN